VSSAWTFGVNVVLVFISYKKGIKIWRETAPYIFLVVIWITYIVLPLVNLTCSIWAFGVSSQMEDKSGTYLLPWITTYGVFSFSTLITYFSKYKKLFVHDIKCHIRLKNVLTHHDFDEHI
jgi:hypothetical protein